MREHIHITSADEVSESYIKGETLHLFKTGTHKLFLLHYISKIPDPYPSTHCPCFHSIFGLVSHKLDSYFDTRSPAPDNLLAERH